MSTSYIFTYAVASLLTASLVQTTSVYRSPSDLDAERASIFRRVREHGCPSRVCFALHCSASLSTDDCRAQMEFVTFVADTIKTDPRAHFEVATCPTTEKIAPITRILLPTPPIIPKCSSNLSLVFIAYKLGFCISRLRRPGKKSAAPAKMVFLVDGRTKFGGNPRPIARRWLLNDPGNEIYAVGVAFGSKKFLRRITTKGRRVVLVDEWNNIGRATTRLVEGICDLPRSS